MNQIDEHSESSGYPTGATAFFLICAFWLCVAAALVLLLSGCGPSTEIISPARVVCADLDEIVLSFAADSVAVRGGEIVSVTVMGHSGPLYSPPGAMKCWAQYAGE